MRSLVAAAAATFAVPAAAPAGAVVNIIANPGFESGMLAPWTQGTDASNPFFLTLPWDATDEDAFTGGFSARAFNNLAIRQDFAPVAVSELIAFSFALRHPNADGGAPAAITLFHADGSEGVALAITSGTQWEVFDILDQLDPLQTLIGFELFGYTPGDDALTRLDDVLLRVPGPAALGLFGLGVAALGARRRSRA
jgi:hypothetical protein